MRAQKWNHRFPVFMDFLLVTWGNMGSELRISCIVLQNLCVCRAMWSNVNSFCHFAELMWCLAKWSDVDSIYCFAELMLCVLLSETMCTVFIILLNKCGVSCYVKRCGQHLSFSWMNVMCLSMWGDVDRVYYFAELTWFVLLCKAMWMPVVWFWCLTLRVSYAMGGDVNRVYYFAELMWSVLLREAMWKVFTPLLN